MQAKWISHGKPFPELLGLEDGDPSQNEFSMKRSLEQFLRLISVNEFLEMAGKPGNKLGMSWSGL